MTCKFWSNQLTSCTAFINRSWSFSITVYHFSCWETALLGAFPFPFVTMWFFFIRISNHNWHFLRTSGTLQFPACHAAAPSLDAVRRPCARFIGSADASWMRIKALTWNELSHIHKVVYLAERASPVTSKQLRALPVTL